MNLLGCCCIMISNLTIPLTVAISLAEYELASKRWLVRLPEYVAEQNTQTHIALCSIPIQ